VRLLDNEPDLAVCGEAKNIQEARELLATRSPDAVIIDLSLRDGDGLDLIRHIRAQKLPARLLVLSMHDEMIYAERMLNAGANGYIMKQAAADQLLIALRRVLDGGIYVSDAVSVGMIERVASGKGKSGTNPVDRLSNRELQILNFIGHGIGTREIADTLNLSVKTIESHRQRIKKKLSIDTSPKLTRFAVNWVSRHGGF